MRWQNARPTLGMVVIALYSLALLCIDFLNLERSFDFGLGVFAVIMWVLLLADYWSLIAHATDRRQTVKRHLGYPLLLLAPLLILPDLTGLLLLVVLVAYVLELRRMATGRAFTFSFGLILFVTALATTAMVYSERQDPQSPLGDWGEAFTWSFVSLIRLSSVTPPKPLTEDGKALTFVVGACALLAASMLTAQLVTWVVGSQKREDEDEGGDEGEDSADASAATSQDLAAEIASLRAAVEELRERLGPAAED